MDTTERLFKPYNQHQLTLLPPSLDELVPANHLVRVINQVVDQLDTGALVRTYTGGGAPSYHPVMLLKIMTYAYTQQLYSSRRIAKAVREQIPFMWLAGMQQPDFRTINRFRSSRLEKTLDTLFASLLAMLVESGYVRLEQYYVDGTKIEANANRFSYVWKKNVERYDVQVRTQIEELLHHIDYENRSEDAQYGDRDLEELGGNRPITAEEIGQAVAAIDAELQALAENEQQERTRSENVRSENDAPSPLAPSDTPLFDNQQSDTPVVERKRTLQRIRTRLTRDLLPRFEKYQRQREQLGKRNSMSRTDPDATFMRGKDDQMKNGQLKPCYNIQMGTEEQFIVGYSIHQHPTDTTLLADHLEHVRGLSGRMPTAVVADAGYGSEENYAYLDRVGITAYVKDNYYDADRRTHKKKNRFTLDRFVYEPETDTYRCPAGETLGFTGERLYTTDSGYKSEMRRYECSTCQGCAFHEQCVTGKANRIISVRPQLRDYRQKARALLDSPEGRRYQMRHGVEVESVFGHIKGNRGLRRFLLRSKQKVHVEYGLACIAHNLLKIFQAIVQNKKPAIA